jgi:hypothetical protein
MGRNQVHARFWWGNLKVGYHVEDIGVYGMVILKWMLKKYDGRA